MSVALVGPDGRRYSLDDTGKLDSVLKLGFRVETPETPPTALETAADIGKSAVDTSTAATLGAIQGSTLGAPAALLYGAREFGTPEDAARARLIGGAAKKLEEEHPYAAGIGELAGSVASPVNEIGNLVRGSLKATTMLGRVGAHVAAGAPVGLLFGAGKTVGDAALDDAPLTAEKLIAGGGLGALLGGLGGGVGGVIEEGARAVLPSIRTLAGRAGSALDDIADNATLKSFRNTAKELQKYPEKDIEAAINVTREHGHLALSPEAMEESIGKHVATEGARKGSFLDLADAGAAKPAWGDALQNLDAHFAALSPIEQTTGKAAYNEARAALEELATRPKGAGWRDFDVWKGNLQEKAKWLGVSTDDSLVSKLKRGLSGFAREEVDRQLVPVLGTEADAFLQSKATYGALKTAERLAHTGAGRGNAFSLTDIATSLALGHASPFGLIGGLGTKLLREHGSSIIAQVADRLSKEPALQAVAKSFAATLPTTLPKLGQYGAVLAAQAAHSPEHALGAHIAMSQLDPGYAAHAQLAGLEPETPDEHPAVMANAQTMADTAAALKAHDEAIAKGLDHVINGTRPPKAATVLKTQDFGSKQMRQDSQAAHSKRVDEVRRLASDPQALIDRVSKNTGALAVAPGVTAQMTALADRAVKYLAKQAETPPKPGPLARDWTPNGTERHKFALQLEAVQEPMSLLRHASAGTLTKLQIDAVAAVYPAFYAELKTKALERMVSGEAVPYRARMALSLLTGVDADGTMSQRSIAANQTAISRSVGKPSDRMPEQAGGKDLKLGQANRLAMPGERRQLEQGENA